MSNINIRRAVDNMRHNTTVYTPIIEMTVNAIQAIDETDRKDGRVEIRVLRSSQATIDGTISEVVGFEIQDNGIGFTKVHRDSFDTLYTDHKIREGGKGFGRFIALRYFEDVRFESVFEDEGQFKHRSFSMGWDQEIIVSEQVDSSDKRESGTVVTLASPSRRLNIEKKLSTIAGNIVERLLPYFIAEDHRCPDIIVSEQDGSNLIRLNDFVSNELAAAIREVEIECRSFSLPTSGVEEGFRVRLFKVYSPGNQKSRVSLVAHRREATDSRIDKYVPEFEDEFVESVGQGEEPGSRNYIIKIYVFGSYLDRNVSLERTGFEFGADPSLFHEIGRTQIERRASTIARDAMGDDIRYRKERKEEIVQAFVDERAPWHKSILAQADLGDLPLRPNDEEIDTFLHRKKFERDVAIRREVQQLIEEGDWQAYDETVSSVVEKASDSSKDELIHYVAFRRTILELFERGLQVSEEGKYSSEGQVHDIIFPRRGDTDSTPLDKHNLWIIDERLNFTAFITSDVPLAGGTTERPDLLVYDKRVLFRGDNEESNPITIFEFKKPQRDDFVNPSSKEDPVQQIVRYVNDIRDGKYKTREGRNMRVAENTPFYGYVVCDLTKKVKTWLEREKNFTQMPDREGWFHWMGNINLYIEVISWDKVLSDAIKRNQIFFKTLGI